MSLKSHFEVLDSSFEGEIRFDEPLSKHTYFKIGGPADVFAIPKSAEDLEQIGRVLNEAGAEFFILGRGSNVLISDSGFRGVVIQTNSIGREIEEIRPGVLRTGAGVAISTLLNSVSRLGLGGLEFLAGVPGSVGGAVFMNAGTSIGESGEALLAVETVQLKDACSRRLEGEGLTFSYRKNHFLEPGEVVTAAEWKVSESTAPQIKDRMMGILSKRKEAQPVDQPCCGSVFKNPKVHGKSAWQVVEAVGMRGHRIGNAEFSNKHSNFIVNLGEAKASDVRELIATAKARASEQLGIELEEEVRYVGF